MGPGGWRRHGPVGMLSYPLPARTEPPLLPMAPTAPLTRSLTIAGPMAAIGTSAVRIVSFQA